MNLSRTASWERTDETGKEATLIGKTTAPESPPALRVKEDSVRDLSMSRLSLLSAFSFRFGSYLATWLRSRSEWSQFGPCDHMRFLVR